MRILRILLTNTLKSMPIQRQFTHTTLWLQWIIAGAVGGFAGAAGANLFPAALASTLAPLTSGACVALLQWLILRHYIPRAWRWIVVSIVAYVVGWQIGLIGVVFSTGALSALGLVPQGQNDIDTAVRGALVYVTGGLIVGGIVGFAQSMVLRATTPEFHGWLRANIIGWGAGAIVYGAMQAPLIADTGQTASGIAATFTTAFGEPGGSTLLWATVWMLVWSVISVCTGHTLMRLPRAAMNEE